MRMPRAFLTWITDWRTGLVLLASLFVAAVIAFVVTSGVTTHDALDTQHSDRAAATRRIDALQAEIGSLRSDLVGEARDNGRRIGELTDQITVLEEQVRQLGGQPVVTTPPRPASTTTTTVASTTTTTQPPPTTTSTTTPNQKHCVLVVCR